MNEPAGQVARHRKCSADLAARGQGHVLRWWGELDEAQRDELLTDIESIPWTLVDPLLASHIRHKPQHNVPADLAPAPVYPRQPGADQEALYTAARRRGRALLLGGKVVPFTVAGGQGTRLGFDGPKGAVSVTPLGDRTLFGLFANMIHAARRRYGVAVPWYIMTSRANHQETLEFFRGHGFFGLPEEDVVLFSQGMLPAFDFDGHLLLESRHRLALAPDGHGGSLKALVGSGALADMRRRGIEIISYFQIDNPLVMPFDPLFVGLHAELGSQASTKVTPKADDLERVGNVCLADGKITVIEYSDFPETSARERTPDDRRRFDAGNLAIHLFDVDFIDRVVGDSFQLPIRRAEKAVTHIDETGGLRKPDRPNAVKLETFVFDVLPLATRSLVLEVDRAEEFSPVKNATGVDSLDSAKRDQVARAFRWLEAAGVTVPKKPDGTPDVTIAIDPTFAMDPEELSTKIDHLPALERGSEVYLE